MPVKRSKYCFEDVAAYLLFTDDWMPHPQPPGYLGPHVQSVSPRSSSSWLFVVVSRLPVSNGLPISPAPNPELLSKDLLAIYRSSSGLKFMGESFCFCKFFKSTKCFVLILFIFGHSGSSFSAGFSLVVQSRGSQSLQVRCSGCSLRWLLLLQLQALGQAGFSSFPVQGQQLWLLGSEHWAQQFWYRLNCSAACGTPCQRSNMCVSCILDHWASREASPGSYNVGMAHFVCPLWSLQPGNTKQAHANEHVHSRAVASINPVLLWNQQDTLTKG